MTDSEYIPSIAELYAILLAKTKRLEDALTKCSRLSGADTTHEPTDIATAAIEEVRQLRQDHDDLEDAYLSLTQDNTDEYILLEDL